MIKKLIHININDFPIELHPYLNQNVYDSSCSKLATVLYIESGYYLKISNKNNLQEEYANTKLFYEIGLGVKVIMYLSLDKDYLLTEAIKGLDGTHYIDEPKHLCEIFANTLKKLHSIEITKFYKNNDNRFNLKTKDEVYNYIIGNIHNLKSDTLLHGDYCLPNIVIDNHDNVKLIDLDHAGIGDKHIDLFWAIWSLSYNLKTEEYNDYFLEIYGKENYDEEMIKLIACIETFG